MITKYAKYNESLMNFDWNIIKKSFRKALKHIEKTHKTITEDHVIEFIIHFIFNNYGIDLTHLKPIYKHIKTYVHHKLKSKE